MNDTTAYTVDRGFARFSTEQVVVKAHDRRTAVDVARPILERRAHHLGKVDVVITQFVHETIGADHQPAFEVTARVFYQPEDPS